MCYTYIVINNYYWYYYYNYHCNRITSKSQYTRLNNDLFVNGVHNIENHKIKIK